MCQFVKLVAAMDFCVLWRLVKVQRQPFWLLLLLLYRVAPQKTEQSIFLGLCSDQQLSFYTLLDIASFPHYNNTKIIKLGWELYDE